MGKKYPQCEDTVALPEVNPNFSVKEIDIDIKGYLFVLCDGMGGSNAGDMASFLCANWFIEDYYKGSIDELLEDWLYQEIIKLNSDLYKRSLEYEQYKGMGTTLVSLLIHDGFAYLHNVGDSRIYLYNDSLKQLTQDHSVVWERYEKGLITKDDMLKQSDKNIITSCLGSKDIPEINRYKVPLPEKYLFLLCSDGLTDVALDCEIKEEIEKSSSLNEMKDNLYTLSQEKNSRDDVSIIIVSNYFP
jgi:protein phosphatase